MLSHHTHTHTQSHTHTVHKNFQLTMMSLKLLLICLASSRTLCSMAFRSFSTARSLSVTRATNISDDTGLSFAAYNLWVCCCCDWFLLFGCVCESESEREREREREVRVNQSNTHKKAHNWAEHGKIQSITQSHSLPLPSRTYYPANKVYCSFCCPTHQVHAHLMRLAEALRR